MNAFSITSIVLSLIALCICFQVRQRPFSNGDGTFTIPKGAKYVRITISGGTGGGGSGKPGDAVASLSVPEFDPTMTVEVIK